MKKIKISVGNIILLFLLLALSSMTFVLQNVIFDMSKLACLLFFFISIAFDIIFVGLYSYFRRRVKKRHSSKYWIQTLPFLLLFGLLYPIKMAILYFLDMATIKQFVGSYLLVLIFILLFGHMFRRTIAVIYRIINGLLK